MGSNAFRSPRPPLFPFFSLSFSAHTHACVHTHTLTRTCCAIEDSILKAAGWLLWVVTPQRTWSSDSPAGAPGPCPGLWHLQGPLREPRTAPLDSGIFEFPCGSPRPLPWALASSGSPSGALGPCPGLWRLQGPLREPWATPLDSGIFAPLGVFSAPPRSLVGCQVGARLPAPSLSAAEATPPTSEQLSFPE